MSTHTFKCLPPQVPTLFPSPKDADSAIRGGVLLVRLKAPDGPAVPLQILARYWDRQSFGSGGAGKRVEKTLDAAALASLSSSDVSTYQSSGVRKAILLARYTDMLRSWYGAGGRLGVLY